jgi:hypothetical protein
MRCSELEAIGLSLSLPTNRDGELIKGLLELATSDQRMDFESCLSDCDGRDGVGITNGYIVCIAA